MAFVKNDLAGDNSPGSSFEAIANDKGKPVREAGTQSRESCNELFVDKKVWLPKAIEEAEFDSLRTPTEPTFSILARARPGHMSKAPGFWKLVAVRD